MDQNKIVKSLNIITIFHKLQQNNVPFNKCIVLPSRSGRGVQHYVIKFVSDLRQVGGFLQILRFPPPIKLTATI